MSTLIEGTIEWWEEENKVFVISTIQLSGYIIDIEFVEALNGVGRSQIHLPESKYFVEYENHTNFVSVAIKNRYGTTDAVILASEHQANEIKNHYETLNIEFGEKQRLFKETISQTVLSLGERTNSAWQLMYNFIMKSGHTVLLSLDHFVGMERILNNRANIGELTLASNARFLYSYQIDADMKELEQYWRDDFLRLSEVISRRIGECDFSERIHIAWSLMRLVAVDYFYDLFATKYGNFMMEAENVSLEEFINRYFNIDYIDTKSSRNAALLTYYLMRLKKYDDPDNFLHCYTVTVDHLSKIIKQRELDEFEKHIMGNPTTRAITINDVDLMTGLQFEDTIAELFKTLGYTVTCTKATGDQGIDIVVERQGIRIGIQTKCYSSSVSNSAIQEVVAGLKHYNLDKGIVVTNNYFTKSAQDLAKSNDIVLWDRDILKVKLAETFR